MSSCNSDCSSCKSNCKDRKTAPQKKALNKNSNIKKVIAVLSGKGGVGKSFVTCLLASACQKNGLKVGVLDADVTGPSVPKSFGIHERAMQDEDGLIPSVTKTGVKIMSVNLLLENENAPVLWRGPVVAGLINQFWSDVNWGELDYLFVDMPPGTSDVALTVFQSLSVDGIVIVTTPQDLVKMIVNKAINMADTMKVPVLGLVENMSYYICEDCGKKINIFGESQVDNTARELKIPVLAKLPINPSVTKLVDEGKIEEAEVEEISEFINALL